MTKKTLAQKLKKVDTGLNKLLINEKGEIVGRVRRKPGSDIIIKVEKDKNGRMNVSEIKSIDRKDNYYKQDNYYTITQDPVSGKLKSDRPIYFPNP